jgi:hypothetical protein
VSNPFWTDSVPVWVSRPTASGQITAFTLSGWMFMLLAVLLLANLFGWSVVGLVELVQYIL